MNTIQLIILIIIMCILHSKFNILGIVNYIGDIIVYAKNKAHDIDWKKSKKL